MSLLHTLKFNYHHPLNRKNRLGGIYRFAKWIDTLDELLGIEAPIMIKIDVEGFETEVLKGAENALKN